MNNFKKIALYIAFIAAIVLLLYLSFVIDQKYEPTPIKVYRYEVVYVKPYIATETNNFGGVIDQELRYYFLYLDGNGETHQVEAFRNTEYGKEHVCVGEKDEYVIEQWGDSYLYLTRSTMEKLSGNKTQIKE